MTRLAILPFHPDPLAQKSTSRDRASSACAVAIAVAVHAGVGIALPRARIAPSPPPDAVLDVFDVAPPPISEREPEPVRAPDRQSPAGRALHGGARRSPVSAPAAVVTRQADPDEPVDLTGGFVTGSGTVYAGGKTSAGARRLEPGPNPTAPTEGTTRPAPGPDRSRRPGLVGSSHWSCPFPPGADADGVDSAVVTLAVLVDASAAVRSVAVLREPGHGFGAAARRCARSRRWQPALDRDGRPLAATVTLNVRFVR